MKEVEDGDVCSISSMIFLCFWHYFGLVLMIFVVFFFMIFAVLFYNFGSVSLKPFAVFP